MQKKVAAFHDISGFGRCALTIALPVLSACGLYCCPVPSAVLSGHTAYPGVTFRDLTDDLDAFIRSWQQIGVRLDGVYSGYLGSAHQAESVRALRETCGAPGCALIVDPVMGDNGKAYSIVKDASFIAAIRSLCAQADVITPNQTECALLLGREPASFTDSREAALDDMKRLCAMGARSVVVTGLSEGEKLGAGYLDAETGESGFVFHRRVPSYYPGTGDLFTSVLTGWLLGRGASLGEAVEKAALFVMESAAYTFEQGSPNLEGVQYERLLGTLTERKDG